MTWEDFLREIDDSHPMTTSRNHIAEICRECEGLEGTVLELGSHAGISTAAIAMASQESVVISVDLCDTVPASQRVAYWRELGCANIWPVADDAGRFLREAEEVGWTFDVIFHDARHGDSVIGEYLTAAALCDVLCIHDFEQLQPSNRSLVSEQFASYRCTVDGLGRMLFTGRKRTA